MSCITLKFSIKHLSYLPPYSQHSVNMKLRIGTSTSPWYSLYSLTLALQMTIFFSFVETQSTHKNSESHEGVMSPSWHLKIIHWNHQWVLLNEQFKDKYPPSLMTSSNIIVYTSLGNSSSNFSTLTLYTEERQAIVSSLVLWLIDSLHIS